MPKVSIIMPAYNAEKYIGEAIQSVLAQTYRDWELIVVDDGSTDDTVHIVKTFSDARIKCVLHQTNAGEGTARNTALSLAQGEYVAFLDADDMLLPCALETNAECLNSNSIAGVVYSDGFYCKEDGTPVAKLSDYRSVNAIGYVLDVIVTYSLLGASCSAMIRHSAIKQRDLKFDPNLKIGTDWDFFIRLAHTEQFIYNPKVTCKYRLHRQNVTVKFNTERRASLGEIRLRVLYSPVFSRLAIHAKYMLLYQLLFDTFENNPEQQKLLVRSEPFDTLPKSERARLLRLLAAHWILQGWSGDQVLEYLTCSANLHLYDLKTRLLLVLMQFSEPLSRTVLRTSRQCRKALSQRRSANPFSVL